MYIIVKKPQDNQKVFLTLPYEEKREEVYLVKGLPFAVKGARLFLGVLTEPKVEELFLQDGKKYLEGVEDAVTEVHIDFLRTRPYGGDSVQAVALTTSGEEIPLEVYPAEVTEDYTQYNSPQKGVKIFRDNLVV